MSSIITDKTTERSNFSSCNTPLEREISSTDKKISHVLFSFFKTSISLTLIVSSTLSLGCSTILHLMQSEILNPLEGFSLLSNFSYGFVKIAIATNFVSSVLTGLINTQKYPKVAQIARYVSLCATAIILTLSIKIVGDLRLPFCVAFSTGTVGLIIASTSIKLLISALKAEKIGIAHVLGLGASLLGVFNFVCFYFFGFELARPPIG